MADQEGKAMLAILGIAVVVILVLSLYYKDSKFKEIERQQAMRRAMLKLQEKNRRYSL